MLGVGDHDASKSDVPTQDRSETDLESFNRNGFLGPIRLYAPDEARMLLRQIRSNNQVRSKILFDNDVNYDRHFDIPELARHIVHPTIIEKVSMLLGPDVLCWRTEFFPKFPGSKGTEWHQVGNYQYATGVPFLVPTLPLGAGPMDITVWTCFTEATRENGCMKFLPGSHKKLYYDESKAVKRGRAESYASVTSDSAFYGYDFEDFKVDPEWMPDESKAVAMEMGPGECVLFSAKCVHASYPNTTKRSTRFALTGRYVASHVKVYPEMDTFTAHGGTFDLSNYGCVQVSGTDKFGHNRIRREDNWGSAFEFSKRT